MNPVQMQIVPNTAIQPARVAEDDDMPMVLKRPLRNAESMRYQRGIRAAMKDQR
jgi:hypothetical protein